MKVTWSGEAGEMGAQVATPLAVALNELLQNAVEHAFVAHSEESQPEVHVLFDRQGDELSVQVRDNGTGLPEDFSIDETTSLGLSIVRGLVNSQLGGRIRMFNSGGTVVELVVPISRADSGDLARIYGQPALRWRASQNLAELPPLLLGGTAPNARLLVGGQSELQATRPGLAGGAYGLGADYLLDRRACAANGEKQVRVSVPACGPLSPVLDIPLDAPSPS